MPSHSRSCAGCTTIHPHTFCDGPEHAWGFRAGISRQYPCPRDLAAFMFKPNTASTASIPPSLSYRLTTKFDRSRLQAQFRCKHQTPRIFGNTGRRSPGTDDWLLAFDTPLATWTFRRHRMTEHPRENSKGTVCVRATRHMRGQLSPTTISVPAKATV
ncbi:hypothetical protein H4582DRAFT_1977157 [Lactarius indigo]|nr:hypothetical protein H4582DRAFT_1977157 [Lactarius indigo]